MVDFSSSEGVGGQQQGPIGMEASLPVLGAERSKQFVREMGGPAKIKPTAYAMKKKARHTATLASFMNRAIVGGGANQRRVMASVISEYYRLHLPVEATRAVVALVLGESLCDRGDHLMDVKALATKLAEAGVPLFPLTTICSLVNRAITIASDGQDP